MTREDIIARLEKDGTIVPLVLEITSPRGGWSNISICDCGYILGRLANEMAAQMDKARRRGESP